MYLVTVDYESLKKDKKRNNKNVDSLLTLFLHNNSECMEVIDDENFYNNNNDLRRALQHRIKKSNFDKKIEAFMINGKVYLRRFYG